MSELIIALGLVAVIEGLVLALAPLRFEDLLKAFASLSKNQRRGMGLTCVALGVFVVWVGKNLL